MMDMEEIIFNIICYAGEARSFMYKALDFAENKEMDKAKESMEKCNEFILKAHKVQTSLIQEEAGGKKIELSMLFVHAQDHIMNVMEAKNLIEHMIKLYEKI